MMIYKSACLPHNGMTNSQKMLSHFIDTLGELKGFLDQLQDCEDQPPELYIELEGNNLSRHGTISLLTVLLKSRETTYIIDVAGLAKSVFTEVGTDGQTLQKVLESPDIIKVFFDVRNDSDALFSLYGIRLNGVEDIQLMELASRSGRKNCVNGLARCIEQDSGLSGKEKLKWQKIKNTGRKLYDPAQGGSYKVFEQRPLSQEISNYCCQDVALMPELRTRYRTKLCDAWWHKIMAETEARIVLSQTVNFNGKGRHMAEAPTGWIYWSPTVAQRLVRTLVGPEIARKVKVETDSTAEIDMGKLKIEDEPPRPVAVAKLKPRKSTASSIDEEHSQGSFYSRDRYDYDDPDDYDYHDHYVGYDDDDGPGDDFTACDKDDCGYCGRCSY